MERPDRLRSGRQLLANQPYDESLEADDVDEVAGTYSQRKVKNIRLRRRLAKDLWTCTLKLVEFIILRWRIMSHIHAEINQ